MKKKKMISTMFASLLIMALCFANSNSNAQSKADSSKMKDCCMMKDGKMMHMKAGKMIPMDKDVTMKNGTKCMVNGDCIMENGKKIKMKEGECMDMDGNTTTCGVMIKEEKGGTQKENENNKTTAIYTCPMHSEVTSDKSGKCSKCGMDLVKK